METLNGKGSQRPETNWMDKLKWTKIQEIVFLIFYFIFWDFIDEGGNELSGKGSRAARVWRPWVVLFLQVALAQPFRVSLANPLGLFAPGLRTKPQPIPEGKNP